MGPSISINNKPSGTIGINGSNFSGTQLRVQPSYQPAVTVPVNGWVKPAIRTSYVPPHLSGPGPNVGQGDSYNGNLYNHQNNIQTTPASWMTTIPSRAALLGHTVNPQAIGTGFSLQNANAHPQQSARPMPTAPNVQPGTTVPINSIPSSYSPLNLPPHIFEAISNLHNLFTTRYA